MSTMIFQLFDFSFKDFVTSTVHSNDIEKAIQRKKLNQLYARRAFYLLANNHYTQVAVIDLNHLDMITRLLKEPDWYAVKLVKQTSNLIRSFQLGDVFRHENSFYMLNSHKLIKL
jgi:hypothetical protein